MRRTTFAIALALCGCDEFQAAVEDAVGDSEAPVIPPPPAAGDDEAAALDPAEATARKLARYAECVQRSLPKVRRSEAGWRATVGRDGKPVKRRVTPQVTTVVDERGVCDRIDREGPTMSPPMAKLEGAAATYVDALRQVAPYTQQLHDYYVGKAYQDDDWERGETLAVSLDGAFGRLGRATEGLLPLLEQQQADNDTARRDALAADSLPWHVHTAMLAARRWTRCVVPLPGPGREVPDLDAPIEAPVESCDVAMSELVAAETGLAARRGEHPDEAARVFWLTSFSHSLAHQRDLAERLHAGPPPAPAKRHRKSKKKDAPPPPPSPADIEAGLAALVLDHGQLSLAERANG